MPAEHWQKRLGADRAETEPLGFGHGMTEGCDGRGYVLLHETP